MQPADLVLAPYLVNDRAIDIAIGEDGNAIPHHLIPDVPDMLRGFPGDRANVMTEAVIKEINGQHIKAHS